MIGNIVFGGSKRTEVKRGKTRQVSDQKPDQQHTAAQQDDVEIGLEDFVVDDMLSAEEHEDFLKINEKLNQALAVDELKTRLALDKYRARQQDNHEPHFNLAWINRFISGNKQYGTGNTTMDVNVLHAARRYFVEKVLVVDE